MRKVRVDKMRRRRRYLDITQSELADMVGITRGYLNQIEKGKMVPGKSLIERIEKSLKLKDGSLVVMPKAHHVR